MHAQRIIIHVNTINLMLSKVSHCFSLSFFFFKDCISFPVGVFLYVSEFLSFLFTISLIPTFPSYGVLPFFFCYQSHIFISVALRHHLNQFPSTLPSWRASVRAHTLQHGTHLHTHTHIWARTFSFIHFHPHSLRNTQTLPHHIHTQSKQWFTTSLFSNVLLASSLLLPFVTADKPWQQHISILPLSSLCQPTQFFCNLTSFLQYIFLLMLRGRREDGIHTVSERMQNYFLKCRPHYISLLMDPNICLMVYKKKMFSAFLKMINLGKRRPWKP